LWFWPSLAPHDPWKPDESYILGLVYEYTLRDNWLVPMLSGEPFMEKPPLFFWTAAWFSRYVFSWLPVHTAARLAAAFYVALTFIFAALAAGQFAARNKTKDSDQATWLTAILVGGTLGIMGNGHHILTDSALFASFAMALYAFSIFLKHPRWSGLLMGTAWGVAFLTKGLLGPGCLGLTALLLPLVDVNYRKRIYLLTLLLALLAALPWWLIWPWHLWLASPDLFRVWFWVNNLGRFLGENNLGPTYEYGFYLKTLPWHAFPLIVYLPILLFRQRLVAFGHAAPAVLLCVLTYVVLSLAKTSMELYAVPAVVAFAVWIGAHATQIPASFERCFGLIALYLMAVSSLLLWWAWAALYFGLPFPANLLHLLPGFAAKPDWTSVLFALVLTLVVGQLAWRAPQWAKHQGAVRWVAALVLCYGLVFSLLLPALNYSKSYRPMMIDLATRLNDKQCLASFGLGEHERGNFHYYTSMRVQQFEGGLGRDCPQLLIQGRIKPANIDEYVLLKKLTRATDRDEEFSVWRKKESITNVMVMAEPFAINFLLPIAPALDWQITSVAKSNKDINSYVGISGLVGKFKTPFLSSEKIKAINLNAGLHDIF
jgi:4-amino-4-deoxy-L-arabinose transferase-like glycosyltransferase